MRSFRNCSLLLVLLFLPLLARSQGPWSELNYNGVHVQTPTFPLFHTRLYGATPGQSVCIDGSGYVVGGNCGGTGSVPGATASNIGGVLLDPTQTSYTLAKVASTGQAADLFGLTNAIDSALGYTPAPFVPMIQANLIADYRFNETTGNLLDRSGAHNDCTLTSGTTAPIRTGVGYRFVDASTQIDCGAALNASETYYLALNFEVGNQPYNYSLAFNAFTKLLDSVGGSGGLRVYATPPHNAGNGYGDEGFLAQNLAGGIYMAYTTDYVMGTHVIALTCPSGSPAQWYIDGNLANLTTATGSGSCNNINSAIAHLSIGPQAVGVTFYEATFYSGADTPNVVAQKSNIILNNIQSAGATLQPRPFSPAQRNLFAIGDSITCGAGLSGSPSCANGQNSHTTYLYEAAGLTTVHGDYVPQSNGIPNYFIQGVIAEAPLLQAPLCKGTVGQSIGVVMAGTNNWGTSMDAGGAAGGQLIMGMNAAWSQIMKNAGCRTILMGMLSRNQTDTFGGSWDQDAVYTNAAYRSGWQSAGFDGFVDLGSDPLLGALGAATNTTYFFDGIHPTQAGHNEAGKGLACIVDSLDGTGPGRMDPLTWTATSGTLTCAQGGEYFDATGGSINVNLSSAMFRTGRQVKYCNATPSSSNTVMITAPSDFPFDNLSGHTSTSIAAGSCVTFTAVWNGNASSPGDFWRTF